MNKARLVSGIQPTGPMHIGNYLGAIRQWKDLQFDYDAYFFIADLHALTLKPQPEQLRENVLDLAAVLLACGVDPKRSTLFLQSSVAAHSELSWLLSPFTSIGALSRMTQYKDKQDRHGANAGLFTYPILMAADVLLYDAQVVPVGDDQVQHLELAREIARSLNAVKKNTVTEPKPIMSPASRIMALNDPSKKMSKSIAGSAIGLLDSEVQITQSIKRAVTDTDPNSNSMSAGVKNLFTILQGVSDEETYNEMLKRYNDGSIRYSELKEQIIDDTLKLLLPIQKAYKQMRSDEKTLISTLSAGSNKAQKVAETTLQRVHAALGLITA